MDNDADRPANLKVIHSTNYIGRKSFGHGVVALNLALEQTLLGCDSEVWSFDNDQDRKLAAVNARLAADKIHTFKKSHPYFLEYSLSMEKLARGESGKNISIYHQHGIWTALSRTSSILREAHATPTIIAPHGSLQSWALKKSYCKKKLALLLYENENLRNVACFHAVAEQEIDDIRNFGLQSPVAVIPNGISSQWLYSTGDGDNFRSRFKLSTDRRILLYLSRITPKKGLPMLLQSMCDLKKIFSNWLLVIAGSDEFQHKTELLAAIERMSLQDKVVFTGPLYDQVKRDAFAAAELFVLPSYSEGAPIVILESLAAGVPVVATKASPWSELETHRCGWWPNIDQISLTEALQDSLTTDSAVLQRMGQRGKELLISKYTWEKSAQKTIELYEWLLGRNDMPDFVVLD